MTAQDPVDHYDTIVLGSGLGGLTAAVLFAKLKGEKVLILEQHSIVGGFTHTFRRGRFEWDTGLHYVGNMAEKDFPRQVMDFVTDAKVRWLPMPPVFEIFSFPNFKFAQRAGEKNLIADLIRQFPAQKEAIENYFKDLMSAQIWGTLRFAAQVLPPFLAWIPKMISWRWSAYGRQTLGEYFAQNIKDPDLRAVLSGSCGDYGLAPSEASLFVHALIVRHYVNGAFYPAGGSGELPRNIQSHLQKLGAEVLTRCEATEILTHRGRVTGVRARLRGEEKVFRAKKVISAIGARQTYGRLLADNGRSAAIAKTLADFPPGLSLASIYLGLKDSPTKLGFGGENHWLFASTDFETMQLRQDLPVGNVQGCYISFPSLKDPSAKQHTAEIMVPASFAAFAKVSLGGWRRRGPDYDAQKEQLAKKVLDFIEARFPGFIDLVEFKEVSTPLSIEHFTRHEAGEVYGIPATPTRYRLKGMGPRTHIKGLFLAGADVMAHGIVGALMSGFCAYTAAGKFRDVVRLFRAIKKETTERRPFAPAPFPAAE